MMRTPPPRRDPAVLTPRELELWRWLAAGLSVRKTALRMGISPKTVDSHSRGMRNKLGVHSAIEAVAVGRERGLR